MPHHRDTPSYGPQHVPTGKDRPVTIDTHLHIWRKASGQHLWLLDSAEGQFDVYRWLMEKHGIDRAVIVGSIRDGNEDNNEYVSSIVRANPGTFQAWGAVNLRSDDAGEQAAHCVDDLGLTGISMYMPKGEDFRFMLTPALEPVWEGLAERRASFNTAVAAADTIVIDKLAERYPGLTIVIAHMGRPVVEEPEPWPEWCTLLELARHPNVYVKLSGFYSFSLKGWGEIEYPYSEVKPFVKALRDAFGADRLTWGSDFTPCLAYMTYRQAYDFIDKHCEFLSDSDKEWIFGKTIMKIVSFDGPVNT